MFLFFESLLMILVPPADGSSPVAKPAFFLRQPELLRRYSYRPWGIRSYYHS